LQSATPGTQQTGNINISGKAIIAGGATISGAAISLNDSSNFATNIGTGSTTSAVSIGNSANTTNLASRTINVGASGATNTIQGIAQATATTAGDQFSILGSTGNGAAGGIVQIQGGAGNGTNMAGGALNLVGGTPTGAGAVGAINIQTSTTGAVSIGNTTGSLTLQGGGTVSLSSSNGTNSTTMNFAGVQAAGNIIYTLDRTVAAGTYGICTSLVSSCGGATGTYVALQGGSPVAQTGNLSVSGEIHGGEIYSTGYLEVAGTLPDVASATMLYAEGTKKYRTLF
jgi:hypothetical protein